MRYIVKSGFVAEATVPICVGSSCAPPPPTTFTLSLGSTNPAAGSQLMVTFTAPSGESTTDIIGLFAAGASNSTWLTSAPTNGATSGSVHLNVPATAGNYEVRYIVKSGYVSEAVAPFCVGTSCSSSGGAGGGGGGGAGGGGGGGGTTPAGTFGGVSFPWKTFDNSIPDTPTAASGHTTFYVDAVHGSDTYDGSSFTFVSGTTGPKKTIGAVLSSGLVHAGDTILLGGGIYREYLHFGALSGAAGAPITIGSYGRGTGAPILDGGLASLPVWTKYTATGQSEVWQASLTGNSQITSSTPVLGIYVNSGTAESALREVIHGQVANYESKGLPATQNQSSITDGSDSWYFNPSTNILYADFGGTLGAGSPNSADVSVLFSTHPTGNAKEVILLERGTNYSNDYFTFSGLTVRASSWGGTYSETSHITFDHCDFKFNGGAGIHFGFNTSTPAAFNTVQYSRVWMNVLANYPRFNNGYTGGGWPGALGWQGTTNNTAVGNVVYQNGGEGLDMSGTFNVGGSNLTSQGNVAKNNIVFDNFSMDLYLVSVENVTAEENFIFNHPMDHRWTWQSLLNANSGFATDLVRRLEPVTVGLGDEAGSTSDGAVHLSNITLVNNVVAGGNRGFLDWGDGVLGTTHGLKNDTIVNNTFVMTGETVADGSSAYGLFLQPASGASTGSLIENNIVVNAAGMNARSNVTATSGITLDYNAYSTTGLFAVASPTLISFSSWRSSLPAWDAHSADVDVGIASATEFTQNMDQKLVYDWSKATPASGGAAHAAGLNLSSRTTIDFRGVTRASGAYDLGAISGF